MGPGRVGIQRPRVRRELQGPPFPQDQGQQGALAQGCGELEESEPAQRRPHTVHLNFVLVEGQATGGSAERRGSPRVRLDQQRRGIGLFRAKVVQHLDGVPLERKKVALGGHLAHQRPQMVQQ